MRNEDSQQVKAFTENLEKTKETRTLDMVWDSQQDIFKYTSMKASVKTIRPTKRLILSRISLLFDPLGLMGPVVLLAKLLMQELWRSGVSWDDPVPEIFVNKWLQYEKELQEFRQIDIPRKVYSNNYLNLTELTEFNCYGKLVSY